MQVDMSRHTGEIKISSDYFHNFESLNFEQELNRVSIYLACGDIKNVAKQLLLEALSQEDAGFVTDFMLELTQEIALKMGGK